MTEGGTVGCVVQHLALCAVPGDYSAGTEGAVRSAYTVSRTVFRIRAIAAFPRHSRRPASPAPLCCRDRLEFAPG